MAIWKKCFWGIGLIAVASGWLLGGAACQERPDRDPVVQTQLMVERLEEVAASQDPEVDLYMNAERVAYFRGRVEELRNAAVASRDGKEILEARLTLATELLRNGQSEEAVQELQALQ